MKIRRALLLDTETDGTDEGSRCIEVGCSVFNVDHAAVETSFASLIYVESNAADRVNGISSALLLKAPRAAWVWGNVAPMAAQCDVIIAHNAEFDRRFVPAEAQVNRPWICSMDDLQWPMAKKPGDSLVSLSLSHGLGVATAHRAMADVDMIARLFTRVHEMGVDLQAFLAHGLRPKALFEGRQGYSRNQEAKDAGFKWDGETRRWLRRMAIDDAAKLPFPVVMVERMGQ